jgi:hypothetical protein
MRRRSAGTAERKHTYGSNTYTPEQALSGLVTASVATPDEVNVGGEATIAVTLDNSATIISTTDTDYCAAGSRPLTGDVNAYELDVRIEIQEGSEFVTNEGVRPEQGRLDPGGGGGGGGGGKPAVTTTACVPAQGEREERYTVETPETGQVRGTVTVTGHGSGNRVDSESFSIRVLPASQSPDRDAGGGDPPEEQDDEPDNEQDPSDDTPRATPTDPEDPPDDPQGPSLSSFWSDRTDGEKVALALGGAGFLAVLSGR